MLPGIPRLVSDGPSGIWPEDVVTNPTSGAEGLLSNIRVIESFAWPRPCRHLLRRPRGRRHQGRVPRRRLHPADDLADHRGNLPAAPPHPSRQEERHAQPQNRGGQDALQGTRRHRRRGRSRPKSPVRLPASDSATTCSRRSIPRSCSPPCRDTAPPALPRHAEPRHRLRHLGRHRAARHRRRRLHPHPQGHAERRHQRRPDGRRDGHPRRHHQGSRDRCRVRDGVRPVGCCRLHGLVSHRDRAGVPAPEDEVTGNPADKYERRPPAWPACGRACAIRCTRPVTAMCCSWRASRPSGRTSARASTAWISSRRTRAPSTPTTPRATSNSSGSCRRSSRRRPARSGWPSPRSGSPRSLRSTPPRTSATIHTSRLGWTSTRPTSSDASSYRSPPTSTASSHRAPPWRPRSARTPIRS